MTNPSTSSDLLTATTTVVQALPGRFFGAVLIPAAAACTLTVYDNATAASGRVLLALSSPASGASQSAIFNAGVVANNGVTVVITGASATGVAYSHSGG